MNQSLKFSLKMFIVPVFLVATSTACQDTITVENEPGFVSSIGPLVSANDNNSVDVNFSVRDPEGDDVSVLFEICDATSTGDTTNVENCHVAFVDFGASDGLAALPAAPADTDAYHLVRWDVSCGQVVDRKTVPADESRGYAARLTVQETGNTVTSDAFSLNDLGVSVGMCER